MQSRNFRTVVSLAGNSAAAGPSTPSSEVVTVCTERDGRRVTIESVYWPTGGRSLILRGGPQEHLALRSRSECAAIARLLSRLAEGL